MTIDRLIMMYICGLFDGEGCVMGNHYINKKGENCYAVILSISNTHRPALEFVKGAMGGGNVLQKNKTTKKEHEKPLFVWSTRGAHGLECMKKLLIGCIIKREQLNIGIDLQQRLDWNKRHPATKITGEEHKLRHDLINDLKEAKHIDTSAP